MTCYTIIIVNIIICNPEEPRLHLTGARAATQPVAKSHCGRSEANQICSVDINP